MSAPDNDLADYFAAVAQRREAAMSAAAADISRVTSAGASAVAAIEEEAAEALRAAVAAVQDEQDEPTDPAPGTWPSDDEDPEGRFLRAIIESDDSIGDDPGPWRR